MTTQSQDAGSSGNPGHTREVEVFVNSRPKTLEGKEATYDQVVRLAFADAFQNPSTIYTVTYKYGHGDKPEGVMVAGDTVKVKAGMHFNVSFTTQS